MTDARATLDAALSEREFARLFEDALRQARYCFFHPHDARKSATILDYFCWSPERNDSFWAELKTQTGKLSVDRWVKDRYGREYFIKGQVSVIEEFRAVGQRVYVFRPADFPLICRVLGLPEEGSDR